MGVYFVTDININLENMDYTDNLPEFLLLPWANVCLLTLFSVSLLVFCLCPSILANICEQSCNTVQMLCAGDVL